MRMAGIIGAISFLLLASQNAHSQDVAAGEKVFAKCKVCHVVDTDKHKVGPSLKGIFGRTVGTVEGFKFSNAMADVGKAGATWDEASLAPYLKDPKGTIKGTKMAFAGLKSDEDIASVLAYLKSVSP